MRPVSFHHIDPEWWSCKRKKRYATLPDPMPKDMRSYECQYCLGIHLSNNYKPDRAMKRKSEPT